MAISLNRFYVLVGVSAAMLCWSVPGTATEIPPPAYQLAAHAAGVPSPVLYAVTLQESGTRIRGQLRPWPWTLNVDGTPLRYRTQQAACAGLTEALRRVSTKRIDVGLGQINVGHQAHRGIAPCDLLDPYRNLTLAATILREQHIPDEDWIHAIGRYHRPAGGAPAARYRRDVQRHLSRVLAPDLAFASLKAPQ
ncbi:transglycosylase SLT domain-containing protein [Pseudomonas chlororaphis]|uniref:transglycosylase SLT domain-containing protein n=1 Tax=Pseudomonas chlororaphis TaxID=587753 RepID=UPI00055D204B|nr:transglycosylase SLT domain-containing protein [Pseudomonas chlororaphis]